MIVRLEEQRYTNKASKYWHGSEFNNWDKSKSDWEYFYMTQSFEYAMFFAHKNDHSYGYMFNCRLNKTLNIFNANSLKDHYSLVMYLIGNFNDEDTLSLVSRLKSEDWLNVLSISERQSLLRAIKDLGYDGFFNYEGDTTENTRPAIGVFDFNNIDVVEILDADGIEDYIESDHILSSHKKQQKSMIRRSRMGVDLLRNTTLLGNEIFELYKSKLSEEQLRELLQRILEKRDRRLKNE